MLFTTFSAPNLSILAAGDIILSSSTISSSGGAELVDAV